MNDVRKMNKKGQLSFEVEILHEIKELRHQGK